MTNANFGTVQHNGKTLSLTQHGGGPMKTLKLFTSDGRALTNLASEDDSILLPNEIRMCECGECQASHADSGDYDFDTLDELCANYGLDLEEVCQLLAEVCAEPDLTQLHAKGKEAWSDVPNATQWVEEMRGNTEATHDTPEGKDVAESVIRDSRSRDINDGDLVEVVSNTGRNTWLADVGSIGTVTSIETINDSISVRLDDVPGKKNVLAGYVSLCDVRKMTA